LVYTLHPSDLAPNADFGSALTFIHPFSDLVAVGAQNDVNGTGSVFIYQLPSPVHQNKTPTLLWRLSPHSFSRGANFGCSFTAVALTTDSFCLLIGAQYDRSNMGTVYSYIITHQPQEASNAAASTTTTTSTGTASSYHLRLEQIVTEPDSLDDNGVLLDKARFFGGALSSSSNGYYVVVGAASGNGTGAVYVSSARSPLCVGG